MPDFRLIIAQIIYIVKIGGGGHIWARNQSLWAWHVQEVELCEESIGSIEYEDMLECYFKNIVFDLFYHLWRHSCCFKIKIFSSEMKKIFLHVWHTPLTYNKGIYAYGNERVNPHSTKPANIIYIYPWQKKSETLHTEVCIYMWGYINANSAQNWKPLWIATLLAPCWGFILKVRCKSSPRLPLRVTPYITHVATSPCECISGVTHTPYKLTLRALAASVYDSPPFITVSSPIHQF